MAKWHGNVGYGSHIESSPGVYTTTIKERSYSGDVIKNYRRQESSGTLNDNVNVANIISIIADPFAYENFHSMVYVEFMNAKWKISGVEVQYPRLLLTVGGLYNE